MVNLCPSQDRSQVNAWSSRERHPEADPLWETSAEMHPLHSYGLGTWPELGTRTRQLWMGRTELKRTPWSGPMMPGKEPHLPEPHPPELALTTARNQKYSILMNGFLKRVHSRTKAAVMHTLEGSSASVWTASRECQQISFLLHPDSQEALRVQATSESPVGNVYTNTADRHAANLFAHQVPYSPPSSWENGVGRMNCSDHIDELDLKPSLAGCGGSRLKGMRGTGGEAYRIEVI